MLVFGVNDPNITHSTQFIFVFWIINLLISSSLKTQKIDVHCTAATPSLSNTYDSIISFIYVQASVQYTMADIEKIAQQLSYLFFYLDN